MVARVATVATLLGCACLVVVHTIIVLKWRSERAESMWFQFAPVVGDPAWPALACNCVPLVFR